jgi:hypothetical protein
MLAYAKFSKESDVHIYKGILWTLVFGKESEIFQEVKFESARDLHHFLSDLKLDGYKVKNRTFSLLSKNFQTQGNNVNSKII